MAARLPRVAAADPADALDCASDCSVFLDGIRKVPTAGRLKAAVPPQQGTQQQTIDGNQPEESRDCQPIGGHTESSYELPQSFSHSIHHPFCLTIAGCRDEIVHQKETPLPPAY